MKKVFIIIQIIFFASSCSKFGNLSCNTNKKMEVKETYSSFSKYFGSDDYSTYKDKIVIGNLSLVLAGKYVDMEKSKVDWAVVAEKKTNKIEPHLYIEGESILDRNRKTIFDASVHVRNNSFYGWEITPGKNGFQFNYYFNEGRSVADSISIQWDKNLGLFKHWTPKWEDEEDKGYDD